MKKNGEKLSRRAFLIAGSAAISSPFISNIAGPLATGEAGATELIEIDNLPKGTKIYYIHGGCIGCQACRAFCPVQAISFGHCRNEINQSKCIHCGTCYNECNISVISETILS